MLEPLTSASTLPAAAASSRLVLPPFDAAHTAKQRNARSRSASQTTSQMKSIKQSIVSSIPSTIIISESKQLQHNPHILQFPQAQPLPQSLSSLLTLPSPLQTDFELIEELEQNWEKHYARTSDGLVVTIKNYPLMISESIQTLCQYVTRYAAGITIGSSACIAGGLSTILAHEHVQTLLGLRERFKLIRDLSGDFEVRTMIADWFKNFDLDLPHGKDEYRLVVPLTNETFQTLAKLADELGITNPDMAKICMMITLCGQSEVLAGFREQMIRHVESFWHRAWVRAELTRVMLERFGL